MNYLSIDIETLGLNPETCDVIEIAAIWDNGGPLDKLPTFHCFVDQGVYSGEIYAMAMHSALFQEMKVFPDNMLSKGVVCHQLNEFINKIGYSRYPLTKITLAGKNLASFDLRFLEQLPEWRERIKPFLHHRIIDPGSMFLRADDTAVPDTATCLQRAGLEPSVKHRAVDDALDVIRLIRSKL